MASMNEYTTVAQVIANDESRAALEALLGMPIDAQDPRWPLQLPALGLMRFAGAWPEQQVAQFAAALSAVQVPDRVVEEAIPVSTEYEDASVQLGSASVLAPEHGETHRMFEVVLQGPSHGNPFVDVELSAEFEKGDERLTVGGFYDGEGVYRIRFLPPKAGTWNFRIASNARSLDGITRSVDVQDAGHRGPVGVVDRFHFAYADGEQFVPFGTTVYALAHQGDEVEERTLATLAQQPFNKVRMCVFPKAYAYNENDPVYFPFHRDAEGNDYSRLNPAFFEHLERRIQQLGALGIQVDLILFHPYDRWGFADMGNVADDRYLRYVVRRLAAFSHVWWSLANEYDFCSAKSISDWLRFGEIVAAEDHAHHLLSNHNGFVLFDASLPWVTHCSIQSGEVRKVTAWRNQWHKPVLVDEMGYEGELEWDWGNLTAEEELRRFWEAMMRGGYATHGEVYRNDRDELWWSKGGGLVGSSPARIAFLREVVRDFPNGRIDPLGIGLQCRAGVENEYEMHYFGNSQPGSFSTSAPEGATVDVDVIDTWGMTITSAGSFTGSYTVTLPRKPYMAVRIRTQAAH